MHLLLLKFMINSKGIKLPLSTQLNVLARHFPRHFCIRSLTIMQCTQQDGKQNCTGLQSQSQISLKADEYGSTGLCVSSIHKVNIILFLQFVGNKWMHIMEVAVFQAVFHSKVLLELFLLCPRHVFICTVIYLFIFTLL